MRQRGKVIGGYDSDGGINLEPYGHPVWQCTAKPIRISPSIEYRGKP